MLRDVHWVWVQESSIFANQTSLFVCIDGAAVILENVVFDAEKVQSLWIGVDGTHIAHLSEGEFVEIALLQLVAVFRVGVEDQLTFVFVDIVAQIALNTSRTRRVELLALGKQVFDGIALFLDFVIVEVDVTFHAVCKVIAVDDAVFNEFLVLTLGLDFEGKERVIALGANPVLLSVINGTVWDLLDEKAFVRAEIILVLALGANLIVVGGVRGVDLAIGNRSRSAYLSIDMVASVAFLAGQFFLRSVQGVGHVQRAKRNLVQTLQAIVRSHHSGVAFLTLIVSGGVHFAVFDLLLPEEALVFFEIITLFAEQTGLFVGGSVKLVTESNISGLIASLFVDSDEPELTPGARVDGVVHHAVLDSGNRILDTLLLAVQIVPSVAGLAFVARLNLRAVGNRENIADVLLIVQKDVIFEHHFQRQLLFEVRGEEK